MSMFPIFILRMHFVKRLWYHTPCSRNMCTVTTPQLNYMINTYIDNNNVKQAHKLLEENPLSCNIVSWNMIMTAYVQHNQIGLAHDLFDKMPHKDAVSWNIMLSGFHKTRNSVGLYHCFLQMGRAGVVPNDYTISTLLRAIISTKLDVLVRQIHAMAFHLALNLDVFVGSALIRAYAGLREEEALGRACFDLCFIPLCHLPSERPQLEPMANPSFTVLDKRERNTTQPRRLSGYYVSNK
ncbi:hypothetical protein TSUD_343060 [Trifolium subterraneum]|nr:hypothetical protein TSUD_343060 [Trifolium subterraneum]